MESIAAIIKRSAEILKLKIDKESIELIACRARGTPRVANRLLKRIRDYAQVKANGVVDGKVTLEAMGKLEVDKLGLDEIDRKVLRTIIEKFDGGPVGLDTIAASISEESDTIEGVYEPYLLQLGFLDIPPVDVWPPAWPMSTWASPIRKVRPRRAASSKYIPHNDFYCSTTYHY